MNGLRNYVMGGRGCLICLQVLLLLAMCTRADATTTIRRCCPPGYEFVVLAENEEDGDSALFPHRFRCRELIGDDFHLFGYNFDVTNDTMGIPQCGNLAISVLDGVDDLISEETCIDVSGGQAIALKCTDKPSFINVHRLQKCCRKGSSYDLDKRTCLSNDQSLDVFGSLAGNSIVLFEVETPHCRDDEEVFVEYLSATHRLRLHESSVDVVSVQHEQSEHLDPRTFCVEGVYEQHTDEPLPTEDPEFPQPRSSQLIVRTCRPRSVCNRMPCVRRCCRNEQMLEYRNGESICVEHTHNIRPTFYDLMFPLDADKQQTVVNPPGEPQQQKHYLHSTFLGVVH